VRPGRTITGTTMLRVLIVLFIFGVAVDNHWFDGKYAATAVHIIRQLTVRPG
jgi:hypothetical protein